MLMQARWQLSLLGAAVIRTTGNCMSSATGLPKGVVAATLLSGEPDFREGRGSFRGAFETARRDWPNLGSSRCVSAGGLDWQVQDLGSGPALLLVHGTGASSHSWRDVAPLLATRFRVIAPDLPGHGFTSTPEFGGFSLPAMARALSELLYATGVDPAIVVGHSAGAAVLVRMTLDHLIAPVSIVSINGALLPLARLPRLLVAPVAALMARSPLIPRWIARRAGRPGAVERLITNTGSKLDSTGIRLYRQLVQKPEHVAGALGMMANWDLEPLARDIAGLRTPLQLLTATGDRTISPEDAQRVCSLTAWARITSLGKLGHLAHEEQPRLVSDEIFRLATQAGVLS
jgi:magnesium chelatase accessory protein